MASLAEILGFLDDLLDASRWPDYGPNGLQVPGGESVTTVVTGVSAQRELFARAAEAGAELVLVHHGLMWPALPSPLTRLDAERLRILLEGRISLAAYHLPLDGHTRVGNNALLAEALGCLERGRLPFAPVKGRPVGIAAEFPGEGLPIAELLDRARTATGGREPLLLGLGPDLVQRIGIISGSGGDALGQAIEMGLDALLTGEPEERLSAPAREAGVHVIAAGHYATETHGIRRLGELVADRFGIEHLWVDIPNPV
jgi:dinuclear metal center YbgI/SA1388 family protein